MELTDRRILKTTGLHHWQILAFFSMAILYLFYYFCRYNLGAATPGILKAYHLEKWQFGIVSTVFTLVYAGGQFINGFLADRYGPKRIIIVGALGSVIACVCFGLADGLVMFAVIWGINAYFQSCGVAPGSRILFNWFPERRWATWFGFYNAMCYSGGAIVGIVAAFAIAKWGWRAAFFVPPACLLAMTFVFMWLGREKPQDVGLIPEWEQAAPEKPHRKVGGREYWQAFSHPKMVLVCIVAFGGKFIRWGIINWMIALLAAPIFADKTGDRGFGMPLVVAAIVKSLADWGGAILSIVLGQVSDRFFGGSRWQTIVLAFVGTALPLFWIAQGPSALSQEVIFTFTVKKEAPDAQPATASAPAKAAPATATAPAATQESRYETVKVTWGWALLGVAIFLAGGLVQAVETPLFALPGDILGKEKGGTGVGIMDGWMYLGASLAGVALGWWLGLKGIGGLSLLGYVALGCAVAAIPIRK